MGDYKQRPRILQHCPKAAIMGTLLEANQAPEHRRNNRIDNPPTTTGTRILQSIPSTSSKLQLHPVPMLGENSERETPTPRMQNLPERAGITRETTLHSLLFTSRGTTMLQDFIRSTKVATRRWLLQRGSEGERDDMWGWGRLGGSTIGNREAEGQEQN